MMMTIEPICGFSFGFELEEDADWGDKYLFIYLFIISVGILYHEGQP